MESLKTHYEKNLDKYFNKLEEKSSKKQHAELIDISHYNQAVDEVLNNFNGKNENLILAKTK